jgi:hypothetical protein
MPTPPRLQNIFMTTKSIQANRSFGIVFVVFFALVGTRYWWHSNRAYPYFFGISLLVGATTLLKPSLLTRFNQAWVTLGEILHRVVNPVVLGIMFFGVMTPLGVIVRLLSKRDAMRIDYEPNSTSYWIVRDPPGPDPDSFPNQF